MGAKISTQRILVLIYWDLTRCMYRLRLEGTSLSKRLEAHGLIVFKEEHVNKDRGSYQQRFLFQRDVMWE